jgi:uncharacterized membrane protein HdeD (DUF308 family)
VKFSTFIIGPWYFILLQTVGPKTRSSNSQKGDSSVKLAGVVLLFIGLGSAAFAGPAVPEISSVSAASALALISGVLLVMGGRRRK